MEKQTNIPIYEYAVVLDMGHGGINPSNYTYTTAPSKMYDHKENILSDEKFHNGSILYEGVKNREYGYEIAARLRERGVNVIVPNHHWKDTSLKARVDLCNLYHDTIQPCFFVSEHSNATSTGKARGVTVWTTPGQNISDVLADNLFDKLKDAKRVKVFGDEKDGDGDYEANFYVLANTRCPAVLVENLFFDNIEDARLLFNKEYKEYYVETIVEWIIESLLYLQKSSNTSV